MNCGVAVLVVATSGIWTRFSLLFVGRGTTYGERSIKAEMCSICGSQSRRNKKAAKRFFRKLLKGQHYVPRVIITDKLKSYGAAKREILPGVEHRQHKGLNNRAENSHQPTRLREKKMRKFKSAKQAQRFLSAFGPISGHFQPRRHRLSAEEYRATLQSRFQTWNEVTKIKQVA
jgi:putative transposase